ncbi:MAG: SMI1/KNR4 family protein [Clostridiales bacterium]|nr:SMI1/KNR4 family protein [Clostridiales bacterium]
MKRFFEFCDKTFCKEVLNGGTILYRKQDHSLNCLSTKLVVNRNNDSSSATMQGLIDRPSMVSSINKSVSALIMVYANLNDAEIKELEEQVCKKSIKFQRGKISFPNKYKDFLRLANGLSIMNGALLLDGLQKLTSENVDLPYSPDSLYLQQGNGIRSPSIPNNLIEIGAYMYNRSNIYIDSISGKIFAYDGDYHDLELTWSKKDQKKYAEMQVPLIGVWNNLDEFLLEETMRLWNLYEETPWSYSSMNETTLPALLLQ